MLVWDLCTWQTLPRREPSSVAAMAVSRFFRAVLLAVLLIVVPSFVYLSHSKNALLRDPVSGHFFSDNSFLGGNADAQVKQGDGPPPMNVEQYLSAQADASRVNWWPQVENMKSAWADLQHKLGSDKAAAQQSEAPKEPAVEPAVVGAYAHQMTNETAKYAYPEVTSLTTQAGTWPRDVEVPAYAHAAIP